MKRVLLLPVLALALPAAAQHTELVGRAGLGLLAFGGADAVSATSLYEWGLPGFGLANRPYGSRLGTGFSVGARLQRVGASEGLLALDLGYERLRSWSDVREVLSAPYLSSSIQTYRATGSIALQSQQVTAFLGVGHRFGTGAVRLDASVGPEAAYVYGFRTKGSGTYNGSTAWSINSASLIDNQVDARLRADATVWYGRLGANASYSHGLLSYQRGLTGADRNVYSRTVRLGLAYRLR
jgi:hypothetical protein